MTMSKGEYRVGISFNPSKNDTVSDLKAIAANFIDIVDEIPDRVADQHGGEADDLCANERRRCKALAQTAMEEAAMWAVKAATKGPAS